MFILPVIIGFNTTNTNSTTNVSKDDFASTLITYNHPTAPLATFNQRLTEKLRYRSSPKRVLQEVLAITKEIKSKGLRFDLNTYNALLAAYMRARNDNGVLNTLRDMKKNGVKPTLESYNTMLEVKGYNGEGL